MARVLIVGGGCRGRLLAAVLVKAGHAVRITTRTPAGRTAIEASGAECFVGTPDRLASLRYALEGVAVICWLLATATGAPQEVARLHGERLESMLRQSIDTTVRGIVYEAAGTVAGGVLADGARLAAALTARNAVPYRRLDVDPGDAPAWREGAVRAIGELLA